LLEEVVEQGLDLRQMFGGVGTLGAHRGGDEKGSETEDREEGESFHDGFGEVNRFVLAI
jgi:hypothetical protein